MTKSLYISYELLHMRHRLHKSMQLFNHLVGPLSKVLMKIYKIIINSGFFLFDILTNLEFTLSSNYPMREKSCGMVQLQFQNVSSPLTGCMYCVDLPTGHIPYTHKISYIVESPLYIYVGA